MDESIYSSQVEYFRAELNQSPTRAYDIYGLSLFYSLEPSEITRETYRLGIQPHTPHDFYNLGVLANQENRHKEALDLYSRAQSAGGKFLELYYNLGLTYESLNRKEEAINAFETYGELAQGLSSAEAQSEARKVRAHLTELKG